MIRILGYFRIFVKMNSFFIVFLFFSCFLLSTLLCRPLSFSSTHHPLAKKETPPAADSSLSRFFLVFSYTKEERRVSGRLVGKSNFWQMLFSKMLKRSRLIGSGLQLTVDCSLNTKYSCAYISNKHPPVHLNSWFVCLAQPCASTLSYIYIDCIRKVHSNTCGRVYRIDEGNQETRTCRLQYL